MIDTHRTRFVSEFPGRAHPDIAVSLQEACTGQTFQFSTPAGPELEPQRRGVLELPTQFGQLVVLAEVVRYQPAGVNPAVIQPHGVAWKDVDQVRTQLPAPAVGVTTTREPDRKAPRCFKRPTDFANGDQSATGIAEIPTGPKLEGGRHVVLAQGAGKAFGGQGIGVHGHGKRAHEHRTEIGITAQHAEKTDTRVAVVERQRASGGLAVAVGAVVLRDDLSVPLFAEFLTKSDSVGPADVEAAGLASVQASRRHVRQIKIALQTAEPPLRVRIQRLALDKELVKGRGAGIYGRAAVAVRPNVEIPVVGSIGRSRCKARLKTAVLSHFPLETQPKPRTAGCIVVGSARPGVSPVLGIEVDAEVPADIPETRIGRQCRSRNRSAC